MITADHPLLEVRKLVTEFDTESGPLRAVDQVSLAIYPRQTLALVGESGCGKSACAMSLLRLIPTPPGHIKSGEILFNGQDLTKISERDLQKVRGGQIAMIFQEPMTSMNPVFTVGQQMLEAILLHQKVSSAQAVMIAEESLKRVGIADASRRLRDYPHQMSGGMKQRIMIAMALACKPLLLIADEPTTALDVTIQAQILELLGEIQSDLGMSLMLITHDLGIVAENADVVAIMYAGRIVEYADVYELFDNPLHPYTRGLMACVPQLGHEHERLFTIGGIVPSPLAWPRGCRFEPRCTMCEGDARTRCRLELPGLRQVKSNHWVASWSASGYAEAPETIPSLQFRRPVNLHAAISPGGGISS